MKNYQSAFHINTSSPLHFMGIMKNPASRPQGIEASTFFVVTSSKTVINLPFARGGREWYW